jgi:choline dehydrogenase-like flavoprotein
VHHADAIVVGAGLNGSWVAKELTSGGMKVALIDAGPILPDSTFSLGNTRTLAFSPGYHLFRLKMLLKGDRSSSLRGEPVLNKFIGSRTKKLFLDRRRDPYVTPIDRDFWWIRLRAVGGRGHVWGRVMLRVTDRQLSASGFEWPVRYDDLAPYFSEIERLLEMGGAPSNLAEVPDGEYVHERSLHPLERQFRDAVVRRWPQRRAVVNHVAEYEPAPLSPMLRAALCTNRLRLFPTKVVTCLTTDRSTNVVTGVRTVSAASGAVEFFCAPFVVLAASAFESVRILLNSRSEKFPNGVGNSNGLVGRRILEHVMVIISGELPVSMRAECRTHNHNPFKLNAEPHGFHMPPFAHLENPGARYRFDFGVQGNISTETGSIFLGAFGETVPSDTNRLRLDATKKDRFGVPIASIDFRWAAEDLAMWHDINHSLADMVDLFQRESGIRLQRSVVYNAFAVGRLPAPGSNHESGGARMGHNPASSVVSPYNRVWDAPNVLICDAACFPSIPHQNPTLTMMALAVRASRQLLAEG